MEQAPLAIITPSETKTELIKIEQNNKIFILKIEVEDYYIALNISEETRLLNFIFSRKVSLQEIKDIHKLFSGLNSFNEFIEYIKAAYEKKKITIDLEEEKLLIKIQAEYLFKQHIIEILYLQKN